VQKEQKKKETKKKKMANFDIAYKKTSGNEGGYANVSGDNGGETYCGISRKFWPNWAGWKIVDANKPLKHNQIIKNPTLESLVKGFYKKEFWDKIEGDKIDNQDVADTLYDFGVNAGTGVSIKQIQKVLGLPVTGKITEDLIEAINNPERMLL
jgi:lysozyme family protein